jgi:hypothetical protein
VSTAARPPLRVLDLVASILIAILGAMIGVILLAYVAQLGALQTLCDGASADGLVCNGGYLTGVSVLGAALVVFAWFLTAGFALVRILRRRLAFWLPIVGIVAMIAGFYLIALLANAYQPAV